MGNAMFGLRGLADMTRTLTEAHDINDLLELAAEHACVALGAATVSISRFEDEQDQIRTVINVGELGPGEIRWPTDEVYPVTGDRRLMLSVRERRSQVDCVSEPDCDPGERELLIRLGKGCSLATPIIVDGVVWAEFYATRYESDGYFGSEAVAYAEVLAAILAAAIARAEREADLKHLAFHDPMTGLFNRRALDDWTAECFDVPEGIARLVSIVAVDIDGLKGVNDSRGHASGDQQIRDVAEALTSKFTGLGECAVARVGGDEFTVVVVDKPMPLVVEAINEVCRQISGPMQTVGLSAGVAAAVLTSTSTIKPSELYAAADRAQYVAKRAHSRVAVVSHEFNA